MERWNASWSLASACSALLLSAVSLVTHHTSLAFYVYLLQLPVLPLAAFFIRLLILPSLSVLLFELVVPRSPLVASLLPCLHQVCSPRLYDRAGAAAAKRALRCHLLHLALCLLFPTHHSATPLLVNPSARPSPPSSVARLPPLLCLHRSLPVMGRRLWLR